MENQLGLQFLPPEVIREIASYLKTEDVSACSATCYLLREALNDDLVWKKKCRFKALDYFKWGECEVEPDFEWEKNEPSSLPLSKVCTWRKYVMMQSHLWRNWTFGDYKTVEIEFGSKSQVFDDTQVVFIENDFLYLHSYNITDRTLNTIDEIWSVQKAPFLHSTLTLNLDQYDAEDLFCTSKLNTNVAKSKLVISLEKLVLIYDINLSSFSQIPLNHAFFIDGSNRITHDENETMSMIVSGDYIIGAKKRISSHNPENVELMLYLWNIQTGEKIKEENFTALNSSAVDSLDLLKSEDHKHVIVKLRVKKGRYMYHYYGYNISKLEFSQFTVKVNYCDFEILFDDNVIGAGLQKVFLYSYKTSKKVANMKCNHEILKKTIKIVGGYLLVGTFENVVHVLNPSNLMLINKVKLGFTIYSLNPIFDKFVVINSNNCEVWKIGKTAKKLFKLPTDASFAAVNQYGTKLAVIQHNKIKVLNFW